MATFDITVPAGSGVGAGGAAASAFTEPGDFGGATIDDVSVVGTPTITSDGTTDDTIGIRWRIQTDAGVAIWGDYGSDAISAASASLGNLVSSDTITDGSAPSPNPATAVAADWDEIAYNANYTVNMMGDAETCSWSAFTIRVTYTPQTDVTLTGDPGSLVLSGAVAALGLGLLSAPGSLTLTGAEATLVQGGDVTLAGDPGSLVFSGADAALGLGLASDPGSLALSGAEATLTLSDNVILIGDAGSLVLTGAEATLTLSDNVTLTSDPGSLVLSGAEATLLEGGGDETLVGDPGSLVLSGAVATLYVGGGDIILTSHDSFWQDDFWKPGFWANNLWIGLSKPSIQTVTFNSVSAMVEFSSIQQEVSFSSASSSVLIVDDS